MYSLNQIKNRIRRITASLLTVVLLITGIPFPVFAEAVYEEYLDGWKVQCAWSTMSQDYEWNAIEDEVRQPKIVVSYRMENATKDYRGGDLQFTVPGIGNANRANVVKADKVAADDQDSEWRYTWDSLSDTYTFTNKFSVRTGETVSGGFELLWTLEARDCTDGFEQKKSPVFTLFNDEVVGAGAAKSITLQPLSYRFTSVKDRYRIQMSSEHMDPKEYDSGDKDYVWYDIETRFENEGLARGLYKSDYYVSVELPDEAVPEDIQIAYGGSLVELLPDADGGFGFYPFQNRDGDIRTQESTYVDSFQMGFRKQALEGKEVTVYGHFDRLYQDEDEWVRAAGETEIVDSELVFTIQDYGFQHQGNHYSHSNRSSYENNSGGVPQDCKDRLNALGLYNGKVVQFNLTGRVDYKYGESQKWHVGTATPSNASAAVTATPSNATPSNAEKPWKEEIPEGIEDWNDIHWRDNWQPKEPDDSGRPTYEEIHPVYWIATPSNAIEDGDGEVLVPDITFFGRGVERVKSLFEIQAYAAETATPSDASDNSGETKPDETISGQSQIDEERPYSMVLGNDKIAIFLNDGSIRNLEEYEYDITHLTVPSDSRKYDYEIYTADDLETHFGAYEFAWEGNTESEETVRFPDGVKAVFILVKDIQGSYGLDVNVGVRLHLDWAEQQELDEGKRPDHENRLVNFSYLRALYRNDEGQEVNDYAAGVESYEGAYGEELAERDGEVYQEQLFRDYANVWLRSPVMELVSDTVLDVFKGNETDGYSSHIQNSGTIQADSPGMLERFSLYTVLPEGLQADIENSEIMIEGSGTDVSGAAISSMDFANNAMVSMGEYKGKALLKVDFDFSNAPLEAGQLTTASIGIPVTLSAADLPVHGNYYAVNSYLMVHDDGLDKINGAVAPLETYDIDNDGMTTETMAYSNDAGMVDDDAFEWRGRTEISIHGHLNNANPYNTVVKRYVEEEEEELSEYRYGLNFTPDAANAKNIWFFDRIEQGARIADHEGKPGSYTEISSEWQGEFLSVDTGSVEDLGLVPTVYYSEDPEQEFHPQADGWSLQAGKTVKAIAISLDTSNLEDEMLKPDWLGIFVYINMRAPAEKAYIGKKAVNQYELQYDIYDREGRFKEKCTLPSAATYATLLESEFGSYTGVVIMTKVDADDADKKTLPGAVFELYRKNGERVYTQPGIDGEYVFAENGLNGEFETGSAGTLCVTCLPQGEYYFVETQAPHGYETDGEPIPFMIGLEKYRGISAPELFVELEAQNVRKSGYAVLTKKSEDGRPLQGAEFALYKDMGDGEQAQEMASELITDEHGQTKPVAGLAWGEYYFLETAAPEGYVRNTEPVRFSIGADNAEEGAWVSATNKRIMGSVILTKMDEATKSHKLKGAVFNLYRQDGSLVRDDITTGIDGTVLVDNLDWGSYYFEETKAPEGYGLSTEKLRFSINSQNSGTVQQLTCYDPLAQAEITIHKQINEQYEAFGIPTFLFRIAGMDVSGMEHEWIRSLALDGETKGTVVLSGIPAGTYTITEIEVERYQLAKVELGTNVTLNPDGKSVTAKVDTEDTMEATVTFHNVITQFEKYSHVANATNQVDAKRKATALEVTYLGPEVIELDAEREYTFQQKDLEAVVRYDDGTTERVEFGKLKLDPETVTGSQNTSGSGHTVTVTYEVDGRGFVDTFSVVVKLPIPIYGIIYDANGGHFGADETTNVLKYLWDDDTQVNRLHSGKYVDPEHPSRTFVGWFMDEAGTEGREFDAEEWLATELTKTVRVYAKWNEVKAVFADGLTVARAMRELADPDAITDENTTIEAIKMSENPPNLSSGGNYQVVSTPDSEVPILMWFENGIIYWWSEDWTPELNYDSSYMLFGCTALKDISGVAEWDATNVTNMSYMFAASYGLTDLEALESWKVDNVTNMESMFMYGYGLTDLKGLTRWKVGNVTNMRGMFGVCSSLADASPIMNWNVINVTEFGYMFGECAPDITLPIFTKRPGEWDPRGTYIPDT